MVKYKNKSIKIYSDKDYNDTDGYDLRRRCNAYSEDEPETIKWLESFSDNSIFYDIGSNIGGYSFIANMIHKNIQIYSFEANFMNFYTQLKTCVKNNINNIVPMNVAINDENNFDYFKFHLPVNGGDGTFGEKLKKQMLNSDYSNPFTHKKSNLEVGMLGVSLDSLVYDFGLPVPNYIKLDVDGNELLILNGAKRLLKEKKIKQIFIEVDDKIYTENDIDNYMNNYPYKIKKDINVGKEKKPIRMVLYEKSYSNR